MVENSGAGTILVLGTDPYLIRACHDRDFSTLVVRDVSAHLRSDIVFPPGSDEEVVTDIADVGDVWAALLRWGKPLNHIAGLVTTNEFGVGTVAAVATLLGRPSISMDCAARMRDKYLQKQMVRQAGLPAAAARVVVAGSRERQLPFPGPCVIKPLAGAAATDTRRCSTEAEYLAALDDLTSTSRTPLVVEDLIDVGEEWVVDGVVFQGQIAFASVGRYSVPILEYVSAGSADENVMRVYRVDGRYDPTVIGRARDLAARALQALGYNDGVFHMELFRQPGQDEFVFGECAARRGGAMIQEEVEVLHSVSLAGAAVDIALGRPPHVTSSLHPRHIGTTYLHLPRGTIIDIATNEDMTSMAYVERAHISAMLGVNDPPRRPTSSDRQGMCVVSGDSFEDLDRNMRLARREFQRLSVVAPTFRPRGELLEFMNSRRAAGAAQPG